MLPSRRNPAIVTTPPYPVRAGVTLPSETHFRLGWDGCAARPELFSESRPLHELADARLRHEVAILHEHLAAEEHDLGRARDFRALIEVVVHLV
jgi:hypothetical protein